MEMRNFYMNTPLMHATENVTDYSPRLDSVFSESAEKKKKKRLKYGDTQRGRQHSSGGDDLIGIIPAALLLQESETLLRCFRKLASAAAFLQICHFGHSARVLQPRWM